MPRCSFSYTKIMQAERRGKRIYSFFLCRGAAYLIQRDRKPSAEEKEFIHFSFAEAQLILSKDTASRAQRKKNSFIFPLPRRSLSYSKIPQAERRGKKIHSFFLCRGAAYLIQRYRKPSAKATNINNTHVICQNDTNAT